jgi:hypothetical protein
MSQELEIEIAADGKVVVRTIGIKGPACRDVAGAIAQIIGQTEQEELTPEFYEAEEEVRGRVDVHERY